METKEIEVRFLEIDKEKIITKLLELGAKDLGEELLEESMFYDKELTWKKKFVRIRKSREKIQVTYKENIEETIDSTREIEFEVNDAKKAEAFLEKTGLLLVRRQEKKRHTLVLDNVTCDIDTWPKIPTYIELEGPSEKALRDVAEKIGFEWKNARTESAGTIIFEEYKIPVWTMKFFTFDRFE